MSIGLTVLLVIGVFVVLLALGLEIAIAIGVAAVLGFVLVIHQPLSQIAWTSFMKLNNFVLTAVPMFVFMGLMFSNTGVVRRLFDVAEKLIGGFPGGLAAAVVVANAIFGAISGSAVAAAATFGSIAYPEMERKGYDSRLALGSILVAGTLSVLIPPSILLIIFGMLQSVSIVQLFAAGVIPGILLTILLLTTVIVWAKLSPRVAPRGGTYSWKEKAIAVRNLLPWLGIIGVVLGVIFGGIMTPTEGAAMGAFVGIVTSVAYRQFSWKALRDSLLTTAKVTAMIALLVAVANMMAFVFQYAALSKAFTAAFSSLHLGFWGTMIFIYVLYFILGMFLDDLSMLIVTLPFIVPLVLSLGMKSLWFGILYIVLAELALVTPPFGLCIFALKGVVPKFDTMKIALSGLPFYPAVFALLVLITAFPQIVLWLPSILQR
ncbi:MAG: TRAP transporter large permease [Chloroflexi bacterium]|nr:TRAP transporter large permease [Chloroflexota bacterium]